MNKSNYHLRTFFAFAILLLVAACAHQPRLDYELGYDFSKLETYKILEPDEKMFDNPNVSQIMVRRVGEQIGKNLSSRYQRVLEGPADFKVRYHLVVSEKMSVKGLDTHVGGYSRYGRWWYDDGVATKHFLEGDIIIDILDSKDDKVIWRNVERGKLKEKMSVQNKVRSIELAVARLLSDFPPKPSS